MNEDRFDELLEKCESPIETKLLTKLYPHLSPSHARELEAQKRERITHDGTRIRLDFAFPDLRIAICCDGRSWHEGNPERFDKDRRESRELQLQSWTVLRFSGREINSDSEMVVETIQRAIKRREWYRNRRPQQQQAQQQQRTPIPERAPTERPPIERPPTERPPTERPPTERPPIEQPPIEQPPKIPRQQPWLDNQKAQQKPEGGLCGVISLSIVIVATLILLNFIL